VSLGVASPWLLEPPSDEGNKMQFSAFSLLPDTRSDSCCAARHSLKQRSADCRCKAGAMSDRRFLVVTPCNTTRAADHGARGKGVEEMHGEGAHAKAARRREGIAEVRIREEGARHGAREVWGGGARERDGASHCLCCDRPAAS